MSFRSVVDVASTVVLTGVAILMLVLYLQDRARSTSMDASFVPDWKEWQEDAIRLGSDRATMVIATFMDFTCPYCRSLVPVLDSVLSAFPADVAVDFHHFPLDSHEFAVPGAVAAECAHRQGRFGHMYHVLYDQMESIGMKQWREFAADAGIPDVAAFERCIQLPVDSFLRIGAGRALGESIGVVGTPTIWVNGRQHSGRSVEAFRARADKLGIP